MYENLIEHQLVSTYCSFDHHHLDAHQDHHLHHLNLDHQELTTKEDYTYDNIIYHNEQCNTDYNNNKQAFNDVDQIVEAQQQPEPQQAAPHLSQPACMMEDPVYLNDEHVLNRMLASEKRQNIPTYFETTTTTTNNNQQIKHYQQLDFTESDRRELAIWMNDVCLAEECQPDIFPLSILIVDRFLNFVQTKRQQLQLLGSVALLLASKLRQTIQIPAKHLIYYTQDLITLQELKTWELFVLTTLKWDLSFITPVDFLDILLKRLTIKDEQIISDIEDQAHRLIVQCCFDFKHALYPPSMIAWACLMQAMEPWNAKLEAKNKIIDLYPTIVYKLSHQAQHPYQALPQHHHNHHHLHHHHHKCNSISDQ